MEVKFSEIKAIIVAAFGSSAKSRRTVRIDSREVYHLSNYWDGGSKTTSVFVNLQTMDIMSAEDIPREQRQKAGNPYNLPVADCIMAPHVVVVEHIVFCGKDLGYRICVHPLLMQALENNGIASIAKMAELPKEV